MRTRVGAGLVFLALAWLLPATAMAQTQEPSKDKMGQDHMAKDSMMSKDHMAKDSTMAGHMEKDGGMKDQMSKDGMSKDGMMNDHMAKEAMMHTHGSFTAADGHKVSGHYTLENEKGKQRIELSSDFSVEKASDLYLVLSPEPNGASKGTVVLGELKKSSGEQYFPIPKGTDLAQYRFLVLWSKKGSVTIATAALGASGDAMMTHN